MIGRYNADPYDGKALAAEGFFGIDYDASFQ